MAIVSSAGEVLFAEATERYLQSKRAFNCPPVHLVRGPELIRRHCPDATELTIGISWSDRTLRSLDRSVTRQRFPLRFLGRIEERLYDQIDYKFWPFPGIRAMRESMLASLHQASIHLTDHRGLPCRSVVRRFNHHLTHAATACYTSPFEEAVCAVVDGFGEWSSVACFTYAGSRITPLQREPRWLAGRTVSLGMFYAMVCECCGFESLSKGEEWKVMGLAPYGRLDPELYKLLRPLVQVRGLEIVAGCSPAEYRRRLDQLRRRTRPAGSSPLEAADLAHTGQVVFGEVMTELLDNLYALGLSDSLVLGGGCALNSAWNGQILAKTKFRRLHVPSAPGDDGNALGTALLAYFSDHPDRRPTPA
jgi:carbamoyltransferase